MIPLKGLSRRDQLAALGNDIAKGDSRQLALMLHGLIAGELGLIEDEAMPPGIEAWEKDNWRRHFTCGRLTRDPSTARLPANPALAADALKKRSEPRAYELEHDLIGGGI